MIKSLNQIKLYFTIMGIMALIGIIIMVIMVIIILAGGFALSEFLDQGGYYY